jgi:tetratricopeptide (TPR) repeat protein
MARWQRRLGEAYYALGDLPRCEEHLLQALAGFGSQLPRSRAGWVAELARQLTRQVRGAWWLEGAERSPARREEQKEAALAAALIAHPYYFGGDPLALATVSLLSVNLAERASIEIPMARPYAQLGYLAGVCQLRSVAEAYFARARRNAEAVDDQNELAVALYHEASYHVGEGVWERAHAVGSRALKLLEEIKNPQESEIVQTILAHTEYCTGRYAASIARCEAVFGSARARANVQHEAWGLYASARGLIRLGKLDEALDRIHRSRSLLQRQPELPSELLCLGLSALVHLRRSDLEAAEVDADRALALMSLVSPVFTLGDCYAAVAEVYLSIGEWCRQNGKTLSGSLLMRIDRACAASLSFARLFPIGHPGALLAAGRAHFLVGNSWRAERAFRRARVRAEDLSMPYEVVVAELLLGRHSSKGSRAREAHIRAARIALDRLGCEHPFERTDERS